MRSLCWTRSLCPNEASPAATAAAFLLDQKCSVLFWAGKVRVSAVSCTQHCTSSTIPMSDPHPEGISGRSAEQGSAIRDPRTRALPQQPGKMLGKSSSAFTEALREQQGSHFSCSFHQGSQQSCKGKSLQRIPPEAQGESSEMSPNGKAAVRHSSCAATGSYSSPVHPVNIPSAGPCQTCPGSKCLKSGLK